jgi:hypothetical protein
LRFGLACCCGIAAKISQEKEISGFLNERGLVGLVSVKSFMIDLSYDFEQSG